MKASKKISLKSLEEIPKFKSEKEESAFWDTHSIAKIWDQLEPASVNISQNLRSKIIARRKAKKLISLRLEAGQIESLKQVAQKKGIGYLTLIRLWVSERLSAENKGNYTGAGGI